MSEIFKLASRAEHPQDTCIQVGDVSIGGDNPVVVMAGPCSIESYDQAINIARAVQTAGACVFRGGAFKPRTSPYDFQGLGIAGLEILSAVKRETGLITISEIMDIRDIEAYGDVDILQVGARNMQNFTLLKELGHVDKPILLKRGFSSTIDELLLSAEYILTGGNSSVMLCERGIRTFETRTRNTFDATSVPVLRDLTHLPIICDPSHATGVARYVTPVALAAVAAGAQGIEVEVHHDPAHALSDGKQSITPHEFNVLMHKLKGLESVL